MHLIATLAYLPGGCHSFTFFFNVSFFFLLHPARGHISISMTPRLGWRIPGLEALSCFSCIIIQGDSDGPAQETGRDRAIFQHRES